MAKHNPSAVKSAQTYLFFNNVDFEQIDADYVSNHVRMVATEVCKQNLVNYNEWWTIHYKINKMNEMWTYDNKHFVRWWMDQFVLETASCVYNHVYDSRLLVEQDGSRDRAYDTKAEKAKQEFLKHFE